MEKVRQWSWIIGALAMLAFLLFMHGDGFKKTPVRSFLYPFSFFFLVECNGATHLCNRDSCIVFLMLILCLRKGRV
ncbi:hypothetical protein PS2_000510 [Malus domestica]